VETQRTILRSSWPAGHRSAVVISIDVDSDTWLRREYGDHRVGKRAIGQYDLRAGADRLLRVQADYGVSGTWFWVGQVAEEAPALVRRCHDEGHEIACHTWDHAHYDDLSADDQRADIMRTRDALASIVGAQPVGHKTAGFAPGVETPAVLQSLGFLYQMDLQSGDLPALLQPDAARPPLVHLPPTLFLDDYTLFWDNHFAPDDAFATWQETIDALRDEGALACFTFHPHMMGRPGQSRTFARLLEYMIDLGDIWIARADHVATWWRDREREVI
jgi:peptidoglycan-N-acetylglucosamine deacetylase